MFVNEAVCRNTDCLSNIIVFSETELLQLHNVLLFCLVTVSVQLVQELHVIPEGITAIPLPFVTQGPENQSVASILKKKILQERKFMTPKLIYMSK